MLFLLSIPLRLFNLGVLFLIHLNKLLKNIGKIKHIYVNEVVRVSKLWYNIYCGYMFFVTPFIRFVVQGSMSLRKSWSAN